MNDKLIYLFKNTRSVIKAQNNLSMSSIKNKILPVPKNLSSECGMCIECNIENKILIDMILSKHKITFTSYNGITF